MSHNNSGSLVLCDICFKGMSRNTDLAKLVFTFYQNVLIWSPRQTYFIDIEKRIISVSWLQDGCTLTDPDRFNDVRMIVKALILSHFERF